jgi:hypothetical protein
MRRLAWGRAVLGVVLGAIAGVGCDGGAPGGHRPDGGGQGGAAGGPAAGEPPAIGLGPGSICDPTGWCWYNPRPSGYLMLSVAGTSNADIWIVGDRSPALRFDGTTWSTVPTAMAFTERLWSFSPTDVWAVGEKVSHFDGVAFTPVPEAGPGAIDIWASSPNDIYITVGSQARHFDGQAWTDLPVGGLHVDGSGPDDVWIAENETLWHFDGVSFSPEPPFEDGFIADVAVAARNDVWVASFVSQTFSFVIRHFDGTAWSVVNELPIEFRVQSISATGPNDVWVTGRDLFFGSFVIHWDGQSFESEVGLPQIRTVERVGSDYFAVGDDGKVFRRTAADSPWREISDGPTVALNGTWGSAPDDMWAVGDEGTILHHDGREVSLFPSAATHSTFPSAGPSALFDVWGTGRESAWAVGAEGLILQWNGRTWTTFRRGLPGDGSLLAVFTASPGDVWIGGELSVLFRVLDGELTTGQIPGLPPGVPVRDIHGTSADDIWAVAGGVSPDAASLLTLVSHFDGNAWSPVQALPAQASDPNWRLWAVSSSDAWLRLGRVLIDYGGARPREGIEYWRFDGQSWSQLLVQFPIPSDIWMFGDDGYPEFEPTPNATFSFGQGDVWAAGDRGRWLRRRRP